MAPRNSSTVENLAMAVMLARFDCRRLTYHVMLPVPREEPEGASADLQ